MLKRPGLARFVFISRISHKKNLPFATRILGHIKGEATLDIYGPLEDMSHWAKCQREIAKLPSNVKVEYRGVLEHDQVRDTFAQYEFFLFPTLGENYGHIIVDSLSVGVPVLLGDETPWDDLQECGAGFFLTVHKIEPWIEAVQFCIDCDLETYRAMASNAYRYVRSEKFSHGELVKQNLELFKSAVQQ